MSSDQSPQDILGIRPAAEALKTAIETAQRFVERICGPAADELGLMLKDRVSYWRMTNALRIAAKAEAKFVLTAGDRRTKVHPRLVIKSLEVGSWSDDDEVQEMWAGLLASSRSEEGRDDGNLIFLDLLEQMTVPEARIINHVCEEAKKFRTESGVIYADWLHFKLPDLFRISGINELHRLDRELDHLRALELIDGGLPLHEKAPEVRVAIKPTGLGLNLYVRCQGATESPVVYFAVGASD